MRERIEHEGLVSGIQGDRVHVLIEQTSACAACHAKSMCVSSDKSDKIIEAIGGNQEFTIGEKVMVIGQRSLGLKAVLLAYVLPFIIILTALFVFDIFFDNELIIGTCSLGSLLPYFLLLRLMRNQLQAKFQFYVIKRDF